MVDIINTHLCVIFIKFMKLSCKDVDPNSSCDFESFGNSKTETAGKMLDHAKEEHADKIVNMKMTDEEITKIFESKVRE